MTEVYPRRQFPLNCPIIVCLCGSTRFWHEFQEASLRETLAGKIVLSIGVARAADDDDKSFGGYVPSSKYDAVKQQLDKLHKQKIDLADEVLILNLGGYIGESTRSELEYAVKHAKRLRFLEVPELLKDAERGEWPGTAEYLVGIESI